MPWYIADYLADTMHLTVEEHGAYLLLIGHCWMQGGSLPNDERRLRAISKLDPQQWKTSWPVLCEFFVEQDGVLRQKRVDAELERATRNVEQKKLAGRASADKRNRQRQSNGRSTDDATETPTDISTEQSTEVQRHTQRRGNSPPPPTEELLTNNTSTLTTVDPPDTGGLVSPEKTGLLTLHLRRMGIKAFSTSEEIVDWAKKNVSLEMLDEAVQIARAQLKDEQFSSAYLVKIVDKLLNPKPKKPNGEPQWWMSEKGIETKAREVGCWPARSGESYQQLTQRIREKLVSQTA